MEKAYLSDLIHLDFIYVRNKLLLFKAMIILGFLSHSVIPTVTDIKLCLKQSWKEVRGKESVLNRRKIIYKGLQAKESLK